MATPMAMRMTRLRNSLRCSRRGIRASSARRVALVVTRLFTRLRLLACGLVYGLIRRLGLRGCVVGAKVLRLFLEDVQRLAEVASELGKLGCAKQEKDH